MYHQLEPQRGLLLPGNLPDPKAAFKGYRSLFLIQKPQQPELGANIKIIELRNQDVELPQGDDTLHWCKMFKLQDINEKSHVVKVNKHTSAHINVSLNANIYSFCVVKYTEIWVLMVLKLKFMAHKFYEVITNYMQTYRNLFSILKLYHFVYEMRR